MLGLVNSGGGLLPTTMAKISFRGRTLRLPVQPFGLNGARSKHENDTLGLF